MEKDSFVKWFLIKFTDKAHFMRFLATVVLLITVSFIIRDKAIPDAWWGMFGMVFGFYFRGSEKDSDDVADMAAAKTPTKCSHCGKEN